MKLEFTLFWRPINSLEALIYKRNTTSVLHNAIDIRLLKKAVKTWLALSCVMDLSFCDSPSIFLDCHRQGKGKWWKNGIPLSSFPGLSFRINIPLGS